MTKAEILKSVEKNIGMNYHRGGPALAISYLKGATEETKIGLLYVRQETSHSNKSLRSVLHQAVKQIEALNAALDIAIELASDPDDHREKRQSGGAHERSDQKMSILLDSTARKTLLEAFELSRDLNGVSLHSCSDHIIRLCQVEYLNLDSETGQFYRAIISDALKVEREIRRGAGSSERILRLEEVQKMFSERNPVNQ